MSLATRAAELLAGLPPARTRDIGIRRDISVAMPDGVALLTDRYWPRGSGREPVIVMRSPYGRDTIWALAARLFAERGYQVILQSCRGTGGSEGDFDAYRHEQQDGLATLAWIAAQQWFAGKMAMAGPSYLGIVQWAVAGDAPPALGAIAASISSARVRAFTYPGGAFSLDSTLAWLASLAAQHRGAARSRLGGQATARRRMASAVATLPLGDADRVLTGTRVGFYQDWLARMDDDAFWAPVEFDRHLASLSVPVTMVTGWYDMFLPAQLADYEALRAAGNHVRLTIGPWKHTDLGGAGEALRDSLDWFGTHLLGRDGTRRSRVRVFVGGARRWVEFDEWPPPTRSVRWHLHPAGGLHTRAPADSAPDRYRNDPADPTPSVGGSLLARSGGPRDNRTLERRGDVLVYSSAPLVRDLEIIGPLSAELHVRSTLEHTDFFVRLCDVAPSGKSLNLCDGLVRLTPASWRRGRDSVAVVEVRLWPAAHVFRRGHRLRVQVSSGAHPRFARNLGGGEPLATAVTMHCADQEVWHDSDHPSAIVLPVRDPD
jgi:putative CocE/NonD family hydrolase